MKILLDIDGTIFNNGMMHSRTRELIEKHDVTLYSSDKMSALILIREFNIKFIHKDSNRKPTADVLIDDYANLFLDFVNVDKYYYSIDEFFEVENE